MDIGWKSLSVRGSRVALHLMGSMPARRRSAGVALAGSMNGAAGQMPAFYDCDLFTVNMKELPEDASAALIAHNKSINETVHGFPIAMRGRERALELGG